MNILDTIRESCIAMIDTEDSKDGVLRRIAAMAAGTGLLKPYGEEEIYTALAARERVGSTGYENGVALPHCALDDAREFVAGILVYRDGVDFDSIDNQPSRIFAFIVGPKAERNIHIQLLSAISRMLIEPDVADELLGAGDQADLRSILQKHLHTRTIEADTTERTARNLFVLFIQKEEYFDDILHILSATAGGSITVLDTNNAGYYLHRMPLFSSYWTEPKSGFNRVILAVADRSMSNDIIRRINTLVGTIESETGVLLTVQELSYSNGSLEF